MSTSPQTLAEQLRQFVAERTQRRAELEQERGKIEARRHELLHLPVSREDAKQFIFDYIDVRAMEYPQLAKWPAVFDQVAYPRRSNQYSSEARSPSTGRTAPLCLADIRAGLEDSPPGHFATFENGLQFFGSGSQINQRADYAAYFFFGDVIKAKIDAHFDAFFPGYHPDDSARIGPPIAERVAELQKLEERLAEIGDEETSIARELAQVRPEPPAPSAPSEPPAPDPAEDAAVPVAALRRYNGQNAEELAKECRVSVRVFIAAWHAAERRARETRYSRSVSIDGEYLARGEG